jgi:hypothetical protein
MLGEFFAARLDEVDDALVASGPHDRFPTIEANGLSPVPIARLGELLDVGSYDEVLEEVHSRPGPSGEAVLVAVPARIRNALGEADDLPQVARAWASTEELALSGWHADATTSLLHRLALLARDAGSSGCELWYWWSL